TIAVLLSYGLWWCVSGRRPLRVSARAITLLLGAIGLAVAVAAVQALPAWEAMQLSNRAPRALSRLSLDADTFMGSYHPLRLVTLFIPDVFGAAISLPDMHTDWLTLVTGDVHSLELQAYVGVLPLVLALVMAPRNE